VVMVVVFVMEVVMEVVEVVVIVIAVSEGHFQPEVRQVHLGRTCCSETESAVLDGPAVLDGTQIQTVLCHQKFSRKFY